jgi:predicted CopG family antitoxin
MHGIATLYGANTVFVKLVDAKEGDYFCGVIIRFCVERKKSRCNYFMS